METVEQDIEQIMNVVDVEELFNIADRLEIDLGGLDTISEMQERMLMHLNKNEFGNPKSLISRSLLVTSTEDKHKREYMVSILKEFQKIMEDFRVAPGAGDHKRGTEAIEDQLITEGRFNNLNEELQRHIQLMEKGECVFVVAGQSSAGKSSLINLLVGHNLLPSHTKCCTSVITRISYGKVMCCNIHFKNGTIEKHTDVNVEYVQEKIASLLMVADEERRLTETEIKEVRFEVPSDILKCGMVIVDSPGIGENEAMDNLLEEFIKNNQIMGYIYIIKSDDAGGVAEQGILALLKMVLDVTKKLEADGMQAFQPRSAVFVCNKWDLIKHEEEQKVYNNAVKMLSGFWPNLSGSQVIRVKTKQAQDEAKIDEDFVPELYRVFLERLRDVYIAATGNRLQHTCSWLSKLYKRSLHHLRAVLNQGNLSQSSMEERLSNLQSKLDVLQSKSDGIIEELRNEAEEAAENISDLFREKLKSYYAKTQLTTWMDAEVPNTEDLNKMGWAAIKAKLDHLLALRLVELINTWEEEDHHIAAIENEVVFSIRAKLNLLQEELEKIEDDMDVSHTVDRRERVRTSICEPLMRRSSRRISATKDSPLDENPLPIKLISRVLNPVQNLFKSVKPKKFMSSRKENIYRENPSAVMRKRAQKFLDKMIEDHGKRNMLGEIVRNLLARSTSQLASLERNIPTLIKSNKELLEYVLECNKDTAEGKELHRKMSKTMEASQRKLNQFQLGYVSVKTIRDIQEVCENENRLMSPTFRISNIFRFSSHGSSNGRLHDDAPRGLWTAIRQGTFENEPITLKMYLPTAGLQTTYIEVYYLRKLKECHKHCVAEFEGIHYSDAPPPVLVFQDHLYSLSDRRRRFPETVKPKTFHILEQTLKGLAYLHRNRLVHMELSLDTITVDPTGSVKLTGGCLQRGIRFPTHESEQANNFVYLAPDVLSGEMYSPSSDVYAFGLLIYELLLNASAFKEQRKWRLSKFKSTVDPVSMFGTDGKIGELSEETVKIIKGCLRVTVDNTLATKDLFGSLKGIRDDPVIVARKQSVHHTPREM